jgi:hypothetical protein
MFKDNKGYIAPSVTVHTQDLLEDPITSSGDVDWGFDDNIFDNP